jgi:hypothetical protein
MDAPAFKEMSVGLKYSIDQAIVQRMGIWPLAMAFTAQLPRDPAQCC